MSTILNLGCGSKTSTDPRVVNIDWSPYIILASRPTLRAVLAPWLDQERRKRLALIKGRVLAHDLRKGIPFSDASVDAVYHSHFVEHIDRRMVPSFLSEVRRVLRPGGTHRVVVPDLEILCREYLEDLEACLSGVSQAVQHDARIADMYEQSVRRESFGSSNKAPLRARIENSLLGDARRRGETHQWMYDRVSLSVLLLEAGFCRPVVRSYVSSDIDDWHLTGLDVGLEGNEYKPRSLYMEAAVPDSRSFDCRGGVEPQVQSPCGYERPSTWRAH